MDAHSVLILASVFSLLLMVGLLIFFRSRALKQLYRRVSATITDIRIEASSVSSWWTISASWSDVQTGQTLIFLSPIFGTLQSITLGSTLLSTMMQPSQNTTIWNFDKPCFACANTAYFDNKRIKTKLAGKMNFNLKTLSQASNQNYYLTPATSNKY